ncbi:hypothetical protein BDL97_13G035700 [Sphagnum fallax]|nr:hypothetical protein BDL97_13G035700 [Sphagnum fallax]
MATSVRGGGFVLPPAAAGRSFSSQSNLLSNRLLLLPKTGPVCAPRLCKLRSSSPFAVGVRPLFLTSQEKGKKEKMLGSQSQDVQQHRQDGVARQAVIQEEHVPSTEPSATIIDGKAIAQQVRQEIAAEVSKMKESVGKVPGLAVILVGTRKDSETYVRSKKKACEEVGIGSYGVNLPEDTTQDEVLNFVKKFNDDPAVHGILVQLPLPKHISEEAIVGSVCIEKDVDGFHPMNIGALAMQGRTPLFVSCTPKGCIELLVRTGVVIKGKHAVVIGRSNIVGTPAALLLQKQNATVTVVHSKTPNPAEVTRNADIVIAAVGVPELVRGDWLKPGAVVIDVGINPVEDLSTKKGYRLVGDVCYKEACQVASKITPVPGGVGPMTIAMLLSNTLESAKRAYGLVGAAP